MFNDKNRLWIILLAAAAIIAGCFYGALAGPIEDPPPQRILENKDRADSEITVRYAKIKSVDNEQLTLSSQNYEFTGIIPETDEGVSVGQDISFEGIVKPGPEVEIDYYHVHPWRPLKYYFSLPAIALIIYILFKKYRWSWRRFIFLEKQKY